MSRQPNSNRSSVISEIEMYNFNSRQSDDQSDHVPSPISDRADYRYDHDQYNQQSEQAGWAPSGPSDLSHEQPSPSTDISHSAMASGFSPWLGGFGALDDTADTPSLPLYIAPHPPSNEGSNPTLHAALSQNPPTNTQQSDMLSRSGSIVVRRLATQDAARASSATNKRSEIDLLLIPHIVGGAGPQRPGQIGVQARPPPGVSTTAPGEPRLWRFYDKPPGTISVVIAVPSSSNYGSNDPVLSTIERYQAELESQVPSTKSPIWERKLIYPNSDHKDTRNHDVSDWRERNKYCQSRFTEIANNISQSFKERHPEFSNYCNLTVMDPEKFREQYPESSRTLNHFDPNDTVYLKNLEEVIEDVRAKCKSSLQNGTVISTQAQTATSSKGKGKRRLQKLSGGLLGRGGSSGKN